MYLSPNRSDRPEKWPQKARFFVNDVEVTSRVLVCDTDMGFIICFVVDEERVAANPDKPNAIYWKRDPEGYKGHFATEVLWGHIRVEHPEETVISLDPERWPEDPEKAA